MAQLKDSVVAGSLRVTDTIYGATAQLSAIKIPTTSGGDTLGPGTNGQIIMTNGTDVYWSSTATPSAHNHAAGDINSGTLGITRGGTGTSTAPTQYGIIYASTTSAYASTGAGSSGQYLKSNGTSAPTWATFEAATVGLGSVSNNANLNSTTGAKGDIIYWSAANTPAHLTNTSSTTKKFLSITSQVPSWVTLSNSDVGLGNVENTKLSTWTGSANIKTVGTITSGTWNGTAIASSYIGAHNHAASNITSGQLGVANGGTGAASFTANSAIISGSTTTSALTTRAIHNLSAIGNLGWSSNINTNIATVGSIAYWNGAYSGTSSNLSVLGTVTTGIWHGTAISLDYINNWAFVGRNAEITANKNWYKVASCSISDINQDREMVLHVYDTMVTGAARSGILNVRVRTGSPLTSTTPALNLVWEYNNGFTSDQFKLVSNANTSPCIAELWTNVPYHWTGRVFTVIRMGTRIIGQSNDWTLYKNYSVDDNGATGSTSSLTNSVTASYLDFYTGTISATYKMPAGGITYGIPFKNNDGNLAIASNLYWQDGGYVLRNQAPSGYSPAFQVAGPTKAISLRINPADTNRGLYDTTIDNWAFQLDADSNLILNSGKSTNTYSLITLNPNNSSTNYGVQINGYCAVTLNIYAGSLVDTVERQTGARSGAGKICVYASGSATGDCGIYWWNNANTGRYIIKTAQDGTARFYGKADYVRDITNSGAIDFDYMKSGGYSATPWVCMWVNSNNNGSSGLRVGAVSTANLRNRLLSQGTQSDQMWSWGGLTTNSANTAYVNKELYLVTTTHGLFLWNSTDSNTTWSMPSVTYSSTTPTVVNNTIWLKPV